MTRLCPSETCCDGPSAGLGPLLVDAVETWAGDYGRRGRDGELDMPGALDATGTTSLKLEADQASRTPRSRLFFHHAMLPHKPWFLARRTVLPTADDPAAGEFSIGWSSNGTVGVASSARCCRPRPPTGCSADLSTARGRRPVRRLADRRDGRPRQGLRARPASGGRHEDNHEQVLWTPLIIKAPGQTAARSTTPTSYRRHPADDRRPLGIDLPWDVDGVPVAQASVRAHRRHQVLPVQQEQPVQPPEGELVLEIDDTAGRSTHMIAADLVPRPPAPMRCGGARPTEGWSAWSRRPRRRRGVRRQDRGRAVGRHRGLGIDRPDRRGRRRRRPARGHGRGLRAQRHHRGGDRRRPPCGDRTTLAHGLVLPRLFQDGGNEVTAYVVDGPVGAETLRPVDLVEAG